MLSVFLGGTCGNSTWRNELIQMFNEKVSYFNPVVKNWTEECQQIEDEHKKNDDIFLFVITPETDNNYSISEVTELAILRPESMILCVLDKVNNEEFTKHEKKAWNKIISHLKQQHRACVCSTLKDVAKEINRRAEKKQEIEEGLC